MLPPDVFLLPTMATAHALITLQACKATTLDAVVVATDDERIAEVCRAAGAQVVMTNPDCPNGAWQAVRATLSRLLPYGLAIRLSAAVLLLLVHVCGLESAPILADRPL